MGRLADAADFPLERDAAFGFDARANFLAETLDIGRGGVTGIDEEIGVLLRHHRAAALEAAAPRLIDQLPRLVTRRIGEGRAAGAGADRLAFLARFLNLVHASRDGERIALAAGESRADKDPIFGHARVAVAEAQL